jgi:hypothetical protein
VNCTNNETIFNRENTDSTSNARDLARWMDDEYLKFHVSAITGFKNHEVIMCCFVCGCVISICGKMDKTYSIVRSCKNNDNVAYNATITVKRGVVVFQKYQNS